MKRLSIALFTLLYALSAKGAELQQPTIATPWISVSVPADRSKVYQFISFTCSFCMQTDGMFMEWGSDLPGSLSFEQVPLISTERDIQAALAYYAVREIRPEVLNSFKHDLYRAAAFNPGLNNWNELAVALAERNGIPQKLFKRAVSTKTVKDLTMRAVQLHATYKVDMTPTLAIAGKYVIHAGITNGDYGMLVQLANGLVSRELGVMK